MSTSYTHRPGALREPVLNYRNITKRYGQFQALHGISLDVFKGEVVCLIGPSGSGKSTVLRCTNALEAINSGAHVATPVVVLNRFDPADDLHRRNRDWLTKHLDVDVLSSVPAVLAKIKAN